MFGSRGWKFYYLIGIDKDRTKRVKFPLSSIHLSIEYWSISLLEGLNKIDKFLIVNFHDLHGDDTLGKVFV